MLCTGFFLFRTGTVDSQSFCSWSTTLYVGWWAPRFLYGHRFERQFANHPPLSGTGSSASSRIVRAAFLGYIYTSYHISRKISGDTTPSSRSFLPFSSSVRLKEEREWAKQRKTGAARGGGVATRSREDPLFCGNCGARLRRGRGRTPSSASRQSPLNLSRPSS